MLQDFVTGITIFVSLFTGAQTYGAFGDPFLSIQLATGPDNGECLTTDGTNNIWSSSCGSGGGSGSGTISTSTPFVSGQVPFITGVATLGNEAAFAYSSALDRLSYVFGSTTALSATTICLTSDCRSSWPTGGSGGSGTVGTSSIPTIGNLAYWTSNGFPSLLGSVATTSLTANSPLSLSNPISVIGSLASSLTLDTSGTWSGNAGTATSLAANGSNCSAGQAAGGVTAAGVAEDCTDYWTEAENTSAAYTPQSRTLTIDGTANQISSSAGAQSLAANRTWTLSLPNHVIFPASYQAARGTTTNATSTNLSITGALQFGGVVGSAWSTFCTSITGGSGLCDGSDDTGTDSADDLTNNSIEDLSDVASMTEALGDLLSWNGTAWTNIATSTLNLNFSNILGSITDAQVPNTITLDNITQITNRAISDTTGTLLIGRGGTGSTTAPVGQLLYGGSSAYQSVGTTTVTCSGNTTCTSFVTIGNSPITISSSGGAGGNISGWATSTPFSGQLLLYPTNGTEDVAFGSNGSVSTTTAPFWWDVSATTTYIGNGGVGDNRLLFGSTTIWSVGQASTTEDFYIAKSSNLLSSTGLRITKSLNVYLPGLTNCDTIDTDGSGLLTCGTDGGGGGSSFGQSWEVFGGPTGWLAPTSTLGIIVNASSTFNQLVNANNATSTLFTATTGWFTNLFIGADTIAEYIADTAGAMVSGNTETDITVSYDDADNTFDFVVDTLPNLTGTLDIDSGGTNLTAVGASSTVLTTNGSIMIWQNIATYIIETIRTASTVVITGIWDFSAATIEIPNAANPSIISAGGFALDTTDNQLIIATSTTAAVIPTTHSLGSFMISSSTPPFYGGFSSGIAIPFKVHRDDYVITEIHCDVDGGTSIVINFDNGTGNSDTITCDTDGASDTSISANTTVAAGSMSATIETGTVTGAVDYLRVSVFGVYLRE